MLRYRKCDTPKGIAFHIATFIIEPFCCYCLFFILTFMVLFILCFHGFQIVLQTLQSPAGYGDGAVRRA